jgi:hypothetical protein
MSQVVLEINLCGTTKARREEVWATLRQHGHDWCTGVLMVCINNPVQELHHLGVVRTGVAAREAKSRVRRATKRRKDRAQERRESDPNWIKRQMRQGEAQFQRFKDGE